MAAYGYERPRSRKFRREASSASLTRSWFVGGSTDHDEVMEFLARAENNPVNFQGLARKAVSADSLGAPDLWAGEVDYGVSAVPDGLKPDEVSFRIGAQTVHITQAIATPYRRQAVDNSLPGGDTGTGPDTKDAIGDPGDGSPIQGVDIKVPSFEWSMSVQRSFIDHAFLRKVRALVGRVNDDDFYGYPAATLLYLGCEPTSAVSTFDDASKFTFWNLQHHFAYEPNLTDEAVGGISIPFKNGWEYLWCRYAFDLSGTPLKTIKKPSVVYVSRVYRNGDFEDLEIGT